MEVNQSRALQLVNAAGIISQMATGDKLHLFTAPLTPVDPLPIGGFTEASFTGYAPASLTLANWVPGIDGGGLGIEKYTHSANFVVSTTGAAEVIYGWYITDTTDVVLKAYGFFDAPIAMTNIGDQIVLIPYMHQLVISNEDVEFIAGA